MMNKPQKYGVIIGGMVAILLIMFGIKNYLFAPPAGLNWGTPLDILLFLPTYPIWIILRMLPKEPALFNSICILGITTLFWYIIGYAIVTLMNKKKK